MIFVRFALYAALAASFGLAAFGWLLLPREARWTTIALRRWLLASIAAAVLGSLVALPLTAAQMGGNPVWPIDVGTIRILLGGTALGTAWIVRIAALALAGIVIGVRRGLALAVVATGVALVTLAWGGHGAMDDGVVGWLHLTADALHLLASGLWIGALIGLVLMVVIPADLRLTHSALRGFAPVGSVVVAVLVVTGAINGWLLVGPHRVATLATSAYGRLLVAKLALFAAMLILAALNRYRLTPRFDHAIASKEHRAALRALRTSLAIEASCALTILALVAWLGTLEPPISLG